MYYVYVLKSQNGNKLYTGRSDDLKTRIKAHLNKQVRSTKSYGSFKLIFYEAFLSKKDSIRREKYFKTSKGKKFFKTNNSGVNKIIIAKVAELVDAQVSKTCGANTS